MNERTVGGLLAYADWLRDKGYQSKGAITAWKVAVDKVFRAVDGEDFANASLDADLDDYMRRFQTLVGADYKAETISVYARRIRHAIEAHDRMSTTSNAASHPPRPRRTTWGRTAS